ncbi:hypothetical protein TAMA11512_19930 [Selenomonas sp. TAMA-11512]|nr:hypothetical protein TAMA11512_19930 [Selenomonas sp. TAMA-11512]
MMSTLRGQISVLRRMGAGRRTKGLKGNLNVTKRTEYIEIFFKKTEKVLVFFMDISYNQR